MRKILGVLLVSFLLLSVAGMAFARGGAEAGGKITFRLSHVFLPDQGLHIALTDVAKRINERTNGQIEIVIYPNEEIQFGVDGAELCIQGANFINVYDPGCMGDWVPDYYALIGPMLYSNPEEYSAMCKTDFAKSLNLKAEKAGLKVLALDYNFGMRNMVTTRKYGQIKSINELQGLKMRVPKSNLWIDTFTILGASPIAQGWSELYNSVQTGVVDGYESSISDTLDNNMHEVATYVTKTAHFVGTGAAMMSKTVFDKLTPEQQKIFQEEFIRGAEYNNEMSRRDEAEAQRKLEGFGMIFNEIDLAAWRQRARAWYDNNKNLTPGIYDTMTAELNKIRGR